MAEYTPLQLRLMRIRDEKCGGNAAELARRIKKDATYVNRLFYPAGKPGAKGVGLEIMAACNEAFSLPPGYWDGLEAQGGSEPGAIYDAMTDDERALLEDFRALPDEDQWELRADIAKRAHKARTYVERVLTSMGLQSKPALKDHFPKMSSVPHNDTSGSASNGSSLRAVQPGASKLKTPALDEEDARHQGDDSHEGSQHRGPGRPANT